MQLRLLPQAILALLSCLLLCHCHSFEGLHVSEKMADYYSLYSKFVAPGNTLHSATQGESIEKRTEGGFIKRTYYLDTAILKTTTELDATGKKHGKFEGWNTFAGAYEKGQYSSGKREGNWMSRAYFPPDVIAHYTYVNDQIEGAYISRYGNGTLQNESTYKAGKKHGFSISFDTTGAESSRSLYVDGEIVIDSTKLPIDETVPEFPGGEERLLHFMAKTVKYPLYAMKSGWQGRAYIEFIVDRDGSAIYTHSHMNQESLQLKCVENELERLIKAMPRWKPGMQNNKPVRVKYTLPILFQMK